MLLVHGSSVALASAPLGWKAPMILATADKNQTVVLGDPKGAVKVGAHGASTKPEEPEPLTEREIEEYSRIKCCVCGERIAPEDITKHSRECVLEPAPNLCLQLDKWCIVSAHMTPAEQRALLQMRRQEELSRVEAIEESMRGRPTKLWWIPGCFGFIVCSKWLREWRSFVGAGRQVNQTRTRPPGPVHNNDLFELDGSIRPGLRQGLQEDYEVIDQPIWELYMQVYGGGPTIVRYNTTHGVLPSISDTPVKFEGDWRDSRPDTGAGRAFDPYSGFGFDGEIRGGFLWTCSGKGLLHNGSHYEGSVCEGLPEGPDGREVTPDGTIFEGMFRTGKLHGTGRRRAHDGTVTEGEWEDGELCGI